jgi:hypothetical protein
MTASLIQRKVDASMKKKIDVIQYVKNKMRAL